MEADPPRDVDGFGDSQLTMLEAAPASLWPAAEAQAESSCAGDLSCSKADGPLLAIALISGWSSWQSL